jgi:rRNA-processing protein FCF1
MVAIVLIDSNFLFVPLQFHVDIYEEIPRAMEEKTELVVLSGVKEELIEKNRRMKGSLISRQGMLILQLLARKIEDGKARLYTFKRNEREAVDDYIIRAGAWIKEAPARNSNEFVDTSISRVAVATNDKNLKKKCHAEGLFVLHLREKKRIVLGSS